MLSPKMVQVIARIYLDCAKTADKIELLVSSYKLATDRIALRAEIYRLVSERI